MRGNSFLQRKTMREKSPNSWFCLVRIFGLNTDICIVNIRNQSEKREMRTKNNPSEFGHAVEKMMSITKDVLAVFY